MKGGSVGFVDQADVAVVSSIHDGATAGLTVDEKEEPVTELFHLLHRLDRGQWAEMKSFRLDDLRQCLDVVGIDVGGGLDKRAAVG